MNSLAIIATAGLFFWLGYVVYAEKIQKVFGPDPHRKTPAHTNYDGIDYVPAKHWTILFGHHFSSIAGAGPVVGPILAVSIWGWAPALLWVVLGAIFIGGVHDYCSLMASVRHNGHSIADFAKTTISKKAKIIFLGFVWVALILVISVFAYLCADTFVTTPDIVIPSLGLIPLAVVVGFLLYVKKKNQIWVTLGALFVLGGLLYTGQKAPIGFNVTNPIQIWIIILLIYSYVASVLPVQLLLQPRDYLSAFLLITGLLFGYIGIIAYHPTLQFPAFTSWSAEIDNKLWPILFVTVACGAISGFHCLIASGTTSKQLSNELDAKRIGYGAMIAEGITAVLAILLVAAAYSNIADLRLSILKGGGPIAAFGHSYGMVTEFFMGKFGAIFAILVLNTFILTTLDTATRIARYITEEIFRLKNRYAATLIVIALAGWLGLSGSWNELWSIFGAANQLIAALAMIVITSWLLSMRKPALYTLLPAIFMLAITIWALVLKIIEYTKLRNLVLLSICGVLLTLAFVILYEAIFVGIKNYRRRHH